MRPDMGERQAFRETGIIVAGVDNANDFYVLEDATMRGRPDEWASRAIALYRNYAADRIVGETVLSIHDDPGHAGRLIGQSNCRDEARFAAEQRNQPGVGLHRFRPK
jgi:hypothetical protein